MLKNYDWLFPNLGMNRMSIIWLKCMLTICSREKERKKERESWIKYACCYLIIEEGSLYNSKDDEMD